MGKIYHLEKALSDSIEIQKENMNKIREEIQNSKTVNAKPIISVTEDTPSKKRKYEVTNNSEPVHQQQQVQQTYAGIAGISPLGRSQNQQGLSLLQGLMQKNQPSRNLCFGSAKTTLGGGDGTKLSKQAPSSHWLC